MNNALLFVASGIIAICTYCFLLITLIFSFISTPTHYSSLKDSMIALNAISIEAIIDDNPTPSKVDKKPANVNNPLAGSGIKDMFDRIDSKQPSQNTQIGDNRDKVEQNASNNERLENLKAATQEIQNKLDTLSNLTISTDSHHTDGEYDEWYAEIEKILYQRWQQTAYIEEKLAAVIHIRITNNGVFSYKVVKYSGNLAFDDSLKMMLEECTKKHFPPHPKGNKDIAITFKN